jgi:superfamily II DNA/RNA helicase
MNAPHRTFADFGLSEALISALAKQGIETPTPIQSEAFPIISDGKDAYLHSETGTGKTLAYLLPIFAKFDLQHTGTQAIVVAPTHELAIQIQRQCTDLAQFGNLAVRVTLLLGGTSRDRQIEKLKKKPHIVIGSPGRIRELIDDGKVKPHAVRTIVVDEADRLLHHESIGDIQKIVASTKADRQLVFVSATEQDESNEFVQSLAPNTVMVKTAALPVNSDIEHYFLVCEERDKPDLVRKLYYALNPLRVLVFVHRNETAEIIASKLAHHKVPVADIHGAHDKTVRKQAMESFRSGKVKVLISSDVAARGLDIKDVTHVVNLDIPSESRAYLHRVGRTGRAGKKGVAVSLITKQDLRIVARLRRDLGIELAEISLRDGQVFVAQDPS